MREIPRRERVGREALVHHRERRHHASRRSDRGSTRRPGARAACPCRRACATTSTARRTPCRGEACSAWIAWPGLLADDVELALERVLVHRVDPRAMNTWRMTGSTSFVRSDSPALLVGTSRQPSSTWPSLAIARSISCSHAIRDAGSFGRNTMPTPYWPIAGSVSPCAPHTRRRKRSGSWIRMPAPSPCSGSAPVAPRCERFLRIDSACVTIAWRFWPLMWAMKPRPQASCSFAGS